MIKVLVVEDSPVIQELLTYIINSDPKLHVVGIANNGEEAMEAIKKYKPDIITMDINMPKMDGLNATRQIMETIPTPIIIVTGSLRKQDVSFSFDLLQAGALAVLIRPPGIGHPEHNSAADELKEKLKLMSEIKLVKRVSHNTYTKLPAIISNNLTHRIDSEIQIVAIGASTGGPIVLQKILSGLQKDYSYPVLIVQHIALGFVEGFVDWLKNSSNLPLHIATHGEQLLPGHCYIAPDSVHMGVIKGPRIILSSHAPENGLRPSVAYLFRTVSQVYGPNAAGVLLTGMGRDGADELMLMKKEGAITIAQDQESSVVHGMPGEAIKLNAALHVMAPDAIITLLNNLSNIKL